MCLRKLHGPAGRLMELPVRAPKPSQGGLFWKAPGWCSISISAVQHEVHTLLDYMLLLTFLQRNKTLVKSEAAQLWAKARAHGENQNICLKSAVLTSPKVFVNMDAPRKNNWAQQGLTHVTCTLRHPSCQYRKKVNLQTNKKKSLARYAFVLTKNNYTFSFTTKLHAQDKWVLGAISCY